MNWLDYLIIAIITIPSVLAFLVLVTFPYNMARYIERLKESD